MPKSYFSIANIASLHSLAPGAKIHIIGVSGVAMAQLAVELAKKGYTVSGSDKDFYEPMGSLLRSSSVILRQGYAAGNVPENVNLVVIGNVISYGNPEVDVVEQMNLPYTCFPKILEETLISGKHSIVVTGTHGKSTTSAMIASMLVKLNLDPSYFVGGIVQDLPQSLSWGAGKFSVVEGDEYDSAFFAKVPKFDFYHPDTCIVNAVEYDHADIYPDLESINREFTDMILAMPKSGVAFCCVDFENVRSLVADWRKRASCRIVTFGLAADADVAITSRAQEGFTQHISASSSEFGTLQFKIPVPGAFNAKNALATLLAAHSCGLDVKAAKAALSSFQSVKRRQEIRYNQQGLVLVEDFAHHPTAVLETIQAIRDAFPGKKLWAIFEPRSNTSRRIVFQDDYIRAFKLADYAILCQVEARSNDTDQQLIDVAVLTQKIAETGVRAVCLPNAAEIRNYVAHELKGDAVVVLMSNGSFGGLPQALTDDFKAARG